jgi:hypothetical protein
MARGHEVLEHVRGEQTEEAERQLAIGPAGQESLQSFHEQHQG